jgi:hypothetical protein
MRVNGVISLVASTWLGEITYLHFKVARRYIGSIKIGVSLGTIMEPLTLSTATAITNIKATVHQINSKAV